MGSCIGLTKLPAFLKAGCWVRREDPQTERLKVWGAIPKPAVARVQLYYYGGP